MSNPSKQRGSAFESGLVKYLRELGHDAERLALRGARDEGDLILRRNGIETPAGLIGPRRFVIEAKATARLDLAGWIAQAQVERDNYEQHRDLPPGSVFYVVVHKRRQHGTGKAYVTLPLDEWLRQTA